ncbi:MAG: alkaline phosphatase family protein [Promethearchaeota archaeon]
MRKRTLLYSIVIFSCFFVVGTPITNQESLAEILAVEGVEPGKIAFVIVMDGARGDFFNETICPNIFEKLVPNGVLFTNATTTLPAITTVAHVALITGSYPNMTGCVATSTINATPYHLDGSIERVSFGSNTSIPTETLLSHADDVLTIMIVGKDKLVNMKKGLNEGKGSYFRVLPPKYHDVTVNEVTLDVYHADFPVEVRLQQDSWIINETMSKLIAYKDEIKNGRDTLVVLNLPAPDWTGHALGCIPDQYHPDAGSYRQMIENADHQIGRLISFLDSNDLSDTSSFFICADHGFHNVLPGSWGLRPILSTTRATAFDVAMNTTFFSQDLNKDGFPDNKTYQNLYTVATAENILHLYLRYPEEMFNKTVQFLHEKAIAADFGNIPIFSKMWIRDDYKDLVSKTNYSGLLSDVGMYTETAGDIVIEYAAEATQYGGFKPEFEDSLGDHGVSEDLPIPLLMTGIGFKSGVTESRSASITDIAPTVARLLGIKPPVESNGKVWEEYFVDEGSITEIHLDSLYMKENSPTQVNVGYKTFGTGPYEVQYYVLDNNFEILQQGDQSVTTGANNVTFTWEGGQFSKSPYYFVGQILNSTGHLLDQAQDFIIIATAETPEFPIIWILTFGLIIGVVTVTVVASRQIKKKY